MNRILPCATLALGVVGSCFAQADPPAIKPTEWARAVVFLGPGRDSALRQERGLYRGLLARELARQALLLSAREDFACTTRDVHLGETLPGEGDVVPFDVKFVAGQTSQLKVLRGAGDKANEVASDDLQIGKQVDLAALLVDMEARSQGALRQLLRDAGLTDRPRVWDESLRCPEELSFRLAEMSFVSQWYAARELHAEIARRGASTRLMAALARTYAHLAVLTELDWSPAHDVFAARALLYAQRLVSGGREKPSALACRAYVFALVGLHQKSLDDLAALAKLEAPLDPEEVQRTMVAHALCRYLLDQLDAAVQPAELRELIRLVRCLAHEQSGNPDQAVEEGRQARDAMPHCYRIQAGLDWLALVGLTSYASVEGDDAKAVTLYPRLIALVDLPDEARAWARTAVARAPDAGLGDARFLPEHELPARAKLIAALAAATPTKDRPAELSWPVLSHLILQQSFEEVWRRAYTERRRFLIPADEWLNAARPLYQLHPWAPLLDSYRNDPVQYKAAVEKLATVDLDTLEMQAEEPLREPMRATPEGRQHVDRVWRESLDRADYTANDYARLIQRLSHVAPRTQAPILYALSPHSPQARAAMIAHRWDLVEPQLDAWLSAAKENPAELAAFGRRFLELKQFAKATEVIEAALARSPSLANYRLLAETYRRQGKMDRFGQTIEALFDSPAAAGPNHVRNDIAYEYMQKHQWDAAKICAQKAVDRGEIWGQLSLASCHEALQEWKEAEAIYRAFGEQQSTLDWYSFTLRTGHGNKAGNRSHCGQ